MEEIEKTQEEIAKKVVDFCLGKYKFIFISGNGGSGKTTLSKKISEEINSRGLESNCLDMDDFMIDSNIRKSLQKEWTDKNGNKRISYYGWTFKESYNLNSIESIIYSLKNEEDCFYKPKRQDDLIKLKSKSVVTIIEGVGTAFLEKENGVYGIFIMCDFNTEIDRRIKRSREGESNLPRVEVEEKAKERNEQFEVTILPQKDKFDLELWSLLNYSFKINRDDFNIFN